MYYRFLILAVLLFTFGCKKKGCDIPEEVAKIPVQVEIERLEKPFYGADTREAMTGFLDKNPLFAEVYLQRSEYPSDSVLMRSLLPLTNNASLDTLVQEAVDKFGDMQPEKEQLETAFKFIKHHYPDFDPPQVKTFVTGLGTLGNDLFVSDTLLVFGLDYFIGKDATYRPQAYEYILKRYEREKMVPAAMLLLSNRFNKANLKDRSLLSEMISMGKAYYFVQQVMPCTPDSLIISYTDQQLVDVHHNEGRIWAHFIEKSLLYEKNPFQIQKYIGERPSTPEIDGKAPGRIGTWLGWQIVRAYMERNPNVTLPQLMADTDYRKIFSESKYKPKKK
ncbi:gliding motility-associated lipoprotein GldB [Pontibacter aydingkolensis]|uniref:Gliding motility lipoprotein GldB n=1 Tax=Pontibacter aydingkolensis TaxID=1911536 RepID=A0ABS7CWU7_9BACT|nr:gliding motility lipoprotein GldB [Pontibacter aydingkolensis]MBW7468326.1 gliding motility lipoprotein GldB [Pontibacter aydingkolensis]